MNQPQAVPIPPFLPTKMVLMKGDGMFKKRRLCTGDLIMEPGRMGPDFLFTPLRLPFGGKKDSGWILERDGDRWIERDGAFQYTKELVKTK